MIYVKLAGHDFLYEVEDIIRAFFDNEQVSSTHCEPPAGYRGIFVCSGMYNDREGLRLKTLIVSDGIRRYGREVLLRDLPEEDPKNTGHERRKQIKRELRRELYAAFSEITGKHLPWGTLTGIRPAKIVHEMLEKGMGREEVQERLVGYYKMSAKKAGLLYEVAATERRLLENRDTAAASLYIGIPFCNSRCLYCSFTSNLIGKYAGMVDAYLDALKKEIEGTARLVKKYGYRIQSIYMGGGTPTSIEAGQLDSLLQYIEGSLDLSAAVEYTLEAGRPDSINVEKLEAIKRSKVSRISINPQTMNDETLKLIGRNHTAEDVFRVFELVREWGFGNVNMDTIVGLPGETPAHFENTLKQIALLGPESLTVHALAVKRASRLKEDRKSYSLASPEEAEKMVDTAWEYAAAWGMHPYYLYRQKNILGNMENVGYSKPGYEGIYNMQIMEERQTILAVGAGAVTKAVYPEENRIERAFNVKSVEEYIRRIDEMVERKKALLEGNVIKNAP
ncbi:MAG: coproporphyrinogen dehydrogenase HemZ [Clostridiales bacterium]|jgi:oxygen-independent coproporphyrinogen-3 oxidase|nr:coproporphyrinogen dehydrogenase HemZ [Eubacteriales bacterium]MDH7565509.1 coproporphyrinogen dehydrogenase HemZ [Clostridiales bacterium]